MTALPEDAASPASPCAAGGQERLNVMKSHRESQKYLQTWPVDQRTANIADPDRIE